MFPEFDMKRIRYQEVLGHINRKNLFDDVDNDSILERLYDVGVLGIRLDSGYEQWFYRSKVNLTEFF